MLGVLINGVFYYCIGRHMSATYLQQVEDQRKDCATFLTYTELTQLGSILLLFEIPIGYR
jgi:hypothetical protein